MTNNQINRITVVDILYHSFKENKSVDFVVKQDKRKDKRLRTLMEYSYYQGSRHGTIYLNENKTACAITLNSIKQKTTLKDIYWDLKLVVECIGITRVFKVLKRESLIKKNHPNFKYVHLWYIGVLPNHQGKGLGGMLMTEIMNNASEKCLPIYLETSAERNFKFYENLGFTLTNINSDLGYSLHIYLK